MQACTFRVFCTASGTLAEAMCEMSELPIPTRIHEDLIAWLISADVGQVLSGIPSPLFHYHMYPFLTWKVHIFLGDNFPPLRSPSVAHQNTCLVVGRKYVGFVGQLVSCDIMPAKLGYTHAVCGSMTNDERAQRPQKYLPKLVTDHSL